MSNLLSFLGITILFLSCLAYFTLFRDWETIRSVGNVATVTLRAKETDTVLSSTLPSLSLTVTSTPNDDDATIIHPNKINHSNQEIEGEDEGEGEDETKISDYDKHNKYDDDSDIDSDSDNDKNIKPKNTPFRIDIDPFKEQPVCDMLKLEVEHSSIKVLLKKHGKYVKASQGPRYDHTCFAMKPRYNCARNKTSYTKEDRPAYEFALALALDTKNVTNTSSSSLCDLQQFVRDAGGPAGIARRMLHNHQNTIDPTVLGIKQKVEVMLLGTSRFRQILEALQCGFQDQITDFSAVRVGEKGKGGNNLILLEGDIGAMVDMDYVKNGSCYDPEAQEEQTTFYRKDGTVVPKNHNLCNDNIGMVEFGDASGSSIRFSYVFRPWFWKNTSTPFEKLGFKLFQNQTVDFVFWEPRDVSKAHWKYDTDKVLGAPGSLYARFFDVQNPTDLSRHFGKQIYRPIQERDIGRYYGVDNPWIHKPPDKSHACMPGQPDDKANFLLWYMLSRSELQLQRHELP